MKGTNSRAGYKPVVNDEPLREKVYTEHDPDVLSQLLRNHPEAAGCGHCRYGLVAAPTQMLAMPLYIQRTYEAKAGLVVFCDCPAGQRYRRYLLKVWRKVQAGDEYVPNTWLSAIGEHVHTEQSRTPTVHT